MDDERRCNLLGLNFLNTFENHETCKSLMNKRGKIAQLISVAYLVLIVSCVKKEAVVSHESYERINITIDAHNFDTSPFKSLEFIEIKSKPIGRIKQLYAFDSTLLFSVSSGNERLFLYNLQQETLNPILTKGTGPGEINEVTDLYVDPENNFYALDAVNSMLRSFNAAGSAIEQVKMPNTFDEIVVQKNKITALSKVPYNDKDNYKIDLLENKNGVIATTKQFFPLLPIAVERDFHQYKSVFTYKDTVRFVQPLLDTIYAGFDDDFSIRYVLSFGDKKLPLDLYKDANLNLSQFIKRIKQGNYIWGISTFLENEQFVFLTYLYGAEQVVYFTLYDKKTKKTSTATAIDFIHIPALKNIKITPDFYPVYLTDEAFYFVASPDFLAENNIEMEAFDKANTKNDSAYEGNQLVLKFNF